MCSALREKEKYLGSRTCSRMTPISATWSLCWRRHLKLRRTMPKSEQLFVKSHVARDLLQTAGLFKNERLAVWEYVANSLQYADLPPMVRVTVDSRSRRISIADNGRGLNWDGLRNFFVMHGENQERKAGRPGRGRF